LRCRPIGCACFPRADRVATLAGTLPRARAQWAPDDLVQRAGIVALILCLMLAVALPLWALLSKSFEDQAGRFVGLANYIVYFETPALLGSLWNSVWVALVSTAIVLPLAFVYAYALTRSAIPGKGLFQALALIPILAPSLLPAISLIYLFGNQGLFKSLLMGESIYGPLGIIIAQVFYCFPHALMILVTALATADARLYEAATVLGAGRWRIFWTVTLPGARYGVISAAFVVFTLVITDFGIAKVIGGRFDVLATEIYKQVIGQQNFSMGAVVGMVLLVPAAISFVVDRLVQRRQMAMLTARAVPLVPQPRRSRDLALTVYCAVVGALILGILAISVWASFITYWPYNLTPTFAKYDFGEFDASGWAPIWTSLEMAAWTAAIGAIVVFLGAYLVEKGRGFHSGRALAHLLAMLPLAVPGLVLGLAYIFFFNARANPLNFLYGTLAILVINTIAHFYTVSHLTAVTALKQLDAEFEAVSQSLKVPFHTTLTRVTLPICLPALLDIAVYLFVNAMTTTSAVIFLYGADTKPASVMILHMDEAGQTASAAAMATLIVAASAAVKLLHVALDRLLVHRVQRWRHR
jgi:iron(III) transport system permease protein